MLEVHPCEVRDFADLVRIQVAAFNTGMTLLLKPNPTDEIKAKQVKKHIQSATSESDMFYLKVVDTDLGDKMIAGAIWRLNAHERTKEQIQSMLPAPAANDSPAARDFKEYLYRVRVQFMNTKPFYFLHMLVVDPEHQRRGAGRLLVNWGCDRADKDGVPGFLEASDAGRPLYESIGFEPVHEEFFKLSTYDPSVDPLVKERHTAMIRLTRTRTCSEPQK